jgi:zinc transporter
MGCTALLVGEGPASRVSPAEAAAHDGPGFVWTHIEGRDEADLALLRNGSGIPDIAANALVATETRPRCDRIEDGALINLRGPTAAELDDSDRLVSIRFWVTDGKVTSVSRKPLLATAEVTGQTEKGRVKDPGDLIAAFARAISKQLDPQVAELGDTLDDCESELEETHSIYRLRRTIARIRSDAIAFRRFVAPDRDALETLANLDVEWLQEDDRLHIREAGDRFARMAEELEAVRERAALLHEQLTDLRAEQIDQRALLISIVALIFLPLTFITGLLGMNVEGIPYAHTPWAFWWITGFCLVVAVTIAAWFAWKKWLSR